MSSSTASTSGTKTTTVDKNIVRNYSGFKWVKNKLTNSKLKTIEELVDPQQQLEKSRHRQAELLPGEVLYSHRMFSTQQKLYQHYSEELVFCTTNQVELDFLTKESQSKIKAQGFKLIHLGAVLIGIHGIHRENLDSKVLVALIDARFTDLTKAIIGQMEVSLYNNYELTYIVPNHLQMTISDFCKHVKLIIKTKGYEGFIGEANLLIVKAITARISNHVASNFKLHTEQIAGFLGSQGIKALPGKSFDPNEYNGDIWDITIPKQQVATVPKAAISWKNDKGGLSTRFHGYEEKPAEDSDEEITTESLYIILDDEEEEEGISYADFLAQNPDLLFQYPDMCYEEFVPSEQTANFVQTEQNLGSVVGEKEKIFEEEEGIIETFLEQLDQPLGPPKWDTESLISEQQLGFLETLETEDFPVIDLPEHIEQVWMSEQSGSNFGPPPSSGHGPSQRTFGPATGVNSTIPPLGEWGTTGRRTTLGRPLTLAPITLPSAQIPTGTLLELPTNIARWEDTIRTWESTTINHMSSKNFVDGVQKTLYLENLLGTTVKLNFQQWKAAYPAEYQRLIESSGDTQNLTSQIRQMILGYDEYRGDTKMQDKALTELERLTISDMKDFPSFAAQYDRLASQTGRAYLQPELSEKFFRKLPPPFGSKILEMWEKDNPNMTVGIGPRIVYTYGILQQLCQQNEINRQAKDFSFCRNIEVPGVFNRNNGRRQLRRATTYKGRNPHNNHVRKFKQHKPPPNCKCYLCGELGHFAKNCRNPRVNKERLHVYEEISLPEGIDLISLQGDEDPNDSDICSYDEDIDDRLRTDFLDLKEEKDSLFMIVPWRAESKISEEQQKCHHEWQFYQPISHLYRKCFICRLNTIDLNQGHCSKCTLTVCISDAKNHLQIRVPPSPQEKGKQQLEENPQTEAEIIYQQALYIIKLQDKIKELEEALLTYQLKEDFTTLKTINESSDEEGVDEEIDCTSEQCNKIAQRTYENKLLNLSVILSVEDNQGNIKDTAITAILDTGATKCFIQKGTLPEKYLCQGKKIYLTGLGGDKDTCLKLRKSFVTFNKERYLLPDTYEIQFGNPDRKGSFQLIIGMNFVYSFHGGIQIESGTIKLYKKADIIQTTPYAVLTSEVLQATLELDENMFESMFHSIGKLTEFENQVIPILNRLESLQHIGDNPIKHWEKNNILCKLDIINPDLTIQDKPIIPSPQQKDWFEEQIQKLVKIGVIRKSNSRHRSAAFIVQSGTEIKEGKEVRGKMRMVYNYKRLNDNTHKDQYSLPGIDYLLLKIKDKKVFSKFDLKSGFHQVCMEKESIPWTAFITPSGLYEWLVMPFGLKNAPAVFQRKMDNIFNEFSEFIVVYIDDILIFSDNIEQHIHHLNKFFGIVEKEGLILSKDKMKIGVTRIEFLGLEIGEGKVQLQPHIVKKIMEFKEPDLENLKGLQSFLGLLNYARNYIPNLSKLTGTLYNKCSPHGERRMNKQDWEQVKKIKKVISNLPPLEFPPANSYIIIQTDGAELGWGAILKWKPTKFHSQKEEKIARYASGTYKTKASGIDSEILACLYAFDKFKIFLLDKQEFTLRTDCEAIVKFHNNLNNNRLSSARWVNFIDNVVRTNVNVCFEHVSGKDNKFADLLSRLIAAT